MKKLMTILTIAAIAVTSIFASVTSFDGSTAKAPEMNVTLKSSVLPTNYSLSLLYGTNDFTNAGEQTIDGLDLTKKGSTEEFNVMISNGNLNKTITFVTVITEKPFVGTVDGSDHETNNNLRVLNSDGENQTSYSSKIKAGPQDSQSVATFLFNWDADTELPAGEYVSTNTINISVN
jgi:hypothetical protein